MGAMFESNVHNIVGGAAAVQISQSMGSTGGNIAVANLHTSETLWIGNAGVDETTGFPVPAQTSYSTILRSHESLWAFSETENIEARTVESGAGQ